jgi:hypothetical protein
MDHLFNHVIQLANLRLGVMPSITFFLHSTLRNLLHLLRLLSPQISRLGFLVAWPWDQ